MLAVVLFSVPLANKADQLELVNGDRYVGKVIAITETNVTLRSEINGLMKLPRSKVTVITLGDKPVGRTSVSQRADGAQTNNAATPKDLAAQIKAQGIDPKSVKQVQEQILGAASPEATAKFNEMVRGLITGNISVDDVRAQARSSVKELQAAKKDLGDEFGSVLDGYLNILEGFLNETEADAALAQPAKRSKTIRAREQPVAPTDDK